MKRNAFDEWLAPEVKAQLLQDLEDRWKEKTHNMAIFVSANAENQYRGSPPKNVK